MYIRRCRFARQERTVHNVFYDRKNLLHSQLEYCVGREPRIRLGKITNDFAKPDRSDRTIGGRSLQRAGVYFELLHNKRQIVTAKTETTAEVIATRFVRNNSCCTSVLSTATAIKATIAITLLATTDFSLCVCSMLLLGNYFRMSRAELESGTSSFQPAFEPTAAMRFMRPSASSSSFFTPSTIVMRALSARNARLF